MSAKTRLSAGCLLIGLMVALLIGCGGGSDGSAAPPAQNPPNGVTPTPDPDPAPTSASAVDRGADFMGTAEQFNRYYTDPTWKPSRTLYVSRDGTTDLTGNSELAPASVQYALDRARRGDMIVFLKDAQPYDGCYELGWDQVNGGTYDQPIVLYAQRNDDGSRGVKILPCNTGRLTAINLEGADYVAVDGFEIEGGNYGVRAVGMGFDQEDHQKGVAVLNCHSFGQDRDPFFTGQSDWAVFESNTGHGAGSGDGHGIYLSNGSDWNIVRFNELYDNISSDFQINADPAFTCLDTGMSYDDPRCDGSALDGLGRGASDFMLVEGNFFHNGRGQGPNFTSVRHSVVRGNIIGLYDRHGTSFWQETGNPNLGSGFNTVEDNLFIGAADNRHVLQFVQYSDDNTVRGNLLLGISINIDVAVPNEQVSLMEVDGTVVRNVYDGNIYIGGRFDGYTPNASEYRRDDFSPDWFRHFPFDSMGIPEDWTPTASAPYNSFHGWIPTWNR